VFPSLQGCPVLGLQAVVLVEGWQLWQELFGLAVLAAQNAKRIQQPLWQLPPLQTCPAPQSVPSGRLVHPVEFDPGWQLWQAFRGLWSPVE